MGTSHSARLQLVHHRGEAAKLPVGVGGSPPRRRVRMGAEPRQAHACGSSSMAVTSFTAPSGATPRRSSPTSIFTKTSRGSRAASA